MVFPGSVNRGSNSSVLFGDGVAASLENSIRVLDAPWRRFGLPVLLDEKIGRVAIGCGRR